jgi:hypothetical protein
MNTKLINIIMNNIDTYTSKNTTILSISERLNNLVKRFDHELNFLKRKSPEEYNELVHEVENIDDKNVIGDVVEIDADPDVYKKLLTLAKDEKWIYNGITIVEKKDKWLILFY